MKSLRDSVVDNLKAQLKAVRSEIVNVSKQAACTAGELLDALNEIESLKEEVQDMRKQRDYARQKRDEAEAVYKAMEGQLNSAAHGEQEVTKLLLRNRDLSFQRDNLRARLGKSEAERLSYKTKCEELQSLIPHV